jgi:hypothetical protein
VAGGGKKKSKKKIIKIYQSNKHKQQVARHEFSSRRGEIAW